MRFLSSHMILSVCLFPKLTKPYEAVCRPQRPRGLRRGSAAARLLGWWDLISPGAWMFVSNECCVMSGRDLCVGLNTRQEESYRVYRVWVWSWTLDIEEALVQWGLLDHGKNKHEAVWDIQPRSELSSIARNVKQRLRYYASEKMRYENFVTYTQTHIKWSLVFFLSPDPEVT
jgi:hypothetical protein